ncbi:uncharacterized protein LOC109841005 isoform X1 [Asparagus officinalis]|uniref:uncharacterized protein LOC109841005 isoform X1 n=1 Tax=Asparagus officinalis TaxID=4686 RepID=UPI00098DF1DE|nr:uncharacterized protein LOC109841005 isoform X1 [Asparagus officinalis]
MLFIAGLTHFQSMVLANCYGSSSNWHDANHRPIRTYMDTVRENSVLCVGVKAAWVCVRIQQTYMFGTAIACNITSAASMSELWKSFWFPIKWSSSLLVFGAAQIILSYTIFS